MSDIERDLKALGERTADQIGAPPIAPDSIVKLARRRRFVAGSGSLALALVVAIGSIAAFRAFGTPMKTADHEIFSAAAEATESAVTAKTTMEMSMAIDGFGFDNTFEMKGAGEIDFARNASRLLMSTELPMVGNQPLEMIQVGSVMYTKGQPGVDPDKWAKQKMSGLSGLSGTGGTLQSAEDIFGYLRSVSGDIQVLGTEEMDGTKVTRYRATIDPDAFQEQVGDLRDLPDEMREIDEEVDYTFDPMEVWVDGDDLIRRLDFRMRMEMVVNGSTVSADMSFSTRYFDFGTPVAIRIPDEADVVDQPDPFQAGGEASLESSQIAEVALLMGEERYEGPRISLARDGGDGSAHGCIIEVPDWVVRAELIKTPTGRVLMAVEDFQGHSRIGCASLNPKDVIEDVIQSPTDYSVRLVAEGRTRSIEMVEVARPEDGF